MAFTILMVAQVREWLEGLEEDQRFDVMARLNLLEAEGPSLRRPVVGEIRGSLHDPRMKELICSSGGSLRILFLFDPHRRAVLLYAGDKAGVWNAWYRTAIREADLAYADYLKDIEDEGAN